MKYVLVQLSDKAVSLYRNLHSLLHVGSFVHEFWGRHCLISLFPGIGYEELLRNSWIYSVFFHDLEVHQFLEIIYKLYSAIEYFVESTEIKKPDWFHENTCINDVYFLKPGIIL